MPQGSHLPPSCSPQGPPVSLMSKLLFGNSTHPFMAPVSVSPGHLESPQAASRIITCDPTREATRKQPGRYNTSPSPTSHPLPEAPGPFEPLPHLLSPLLTPTHRLAGCSNQMHWVLLHQNSDSPKKKREPHSLLHKPQVSLPDTP